MRSGASLSLLLVPSCLALAHSFLAGRYVFKKLSKWSAVRAVGNGESAASIEEIRRMSASQIKAELKKTGVNVKAVFEKEELAALLYIHRSKTSRGATKPEPCSSNSVQLVDLVYENGPRREGQLVAKPYVAVDLEIQGRTLRFLLDTGAAEAVISDAAARELGLLFSETKKLHGISNVATIAASTSVSALLGSRTLKFTANVVKTIAWRDVDGIIGISEFQQLGGVVLFDFENRLFSWGSTAEEVLSRDRLALLSNVPFDLAGLILVDVLVDGVECAGFVDIGSSFTVCNEGLVEAKGIQTDALARDAGPARGIDRLAMDTRVMPRCALSMSSIAEEMDLRVIVGMDFLGLGKVPYVFLGLDILRQKCLLVDLNTGSMAIG